MSIKKYMLFSLLLLSVFCLVAMDGDIEAPQVETSGGGTESSRDGSGQPSEKQKYDRDMDFSLNGPYNRNSDASNQFISYQSSRDTSTNPNQPNTISGGNQGASAIQGGGDSSTNDQSVASNSERGLAPLGEWRNHVGKLFNRWGDNIKTKVEKPLNDASDQANKLRSFFGNKTEGPSHGLEVKEIRTKPEAQSQITFSTKEGSPRRGVREWFNDTFGRGTTRKKVQALEAKADELEQQIRMPKDQENQEQVLKKMGVVLDQLEMSRRNLHRSWWSWRDSKTELQKSQESQGWNDAPEARMRYSEALNQRVDALRDILLTSGDLSEGLLKDSPKKALEKAAQVAEAAKDTFRQNAIQQELARRQETKENDDIGKASSKDLLNEIDKMLADGSYKDSKYFEKLQSELQGRSSETRLEKPMYPTDNERWSELQNIFNSALYNDGEFTSEKWKVEKKKKEAEAERVRQERIRQKEETERQLQEEYERQRAIAQQQAAENARLQEEAEKQRAAANDQNNEMVNNIIAQNPSPLDIAKARQRGIEKRRNSIQTKSSTGLPTEEQIRARNERLQNSNLYGNGSRESFNNWSSEQQVVQERKAQVAKEQEQAEQKQAEIDRQVEGITTGNWSEPPVSDNDNVSQGSDTSTGSPYTEDTQNQLDMLNQLQKPDQQQEAAFQRAQSKIDSYASGKRTRTRKPRTWKGFENKYLDGLTDLQKEQLKQEFIAKQELANQQREERRAGGVRGALRGAKNLRKVTTKGFNPLESGAYQ